MRYLLRTLDVDGPGVPVAMLAYAFTPYVLEYSARLSVLLGPWAALPWFVAFAVARAAHARLAVSGAVRAHRAARRRCQRDRADPRARRPGGLRVCTRFWSRASPTGGGWVRRCGARACSRSSHRCGGCRGSGSKAATASTCCASPRRSRDVSATSYPFEVVRGLGYWMFYGRDPVSYWNGALGRTTPRTRPRSSSAW